MNKIYGILLSVAIGLLAYVISSFLPLGAVALAIILGAIIGNSVTLSEKFKSGITFSEKTLLAVAISLLGIHLNFNVLYELGWQTIAIIIFSMISTLAFTLFLAKKLKFEQDFGLLLGIGNGICGSAAIAATKDVLKVNPAKSAMAIAIVNLLGTIGLFVLPVIGLLLGFSDVQIGLFLGNTLQSVGHVVAAGFGVNETVGQSATIVKMGRILLLTPVILWLIYWVSKKAKASSEEKSSFQIPGFVLWFIFFSIVASTEILNQPTIDVIAMICKMTLLVAMSAIGLKISFKAIKQEGASALALAGYIFKFQVLLSIVLVALI